MAHAGQNNKALKEALYKELELQLDLSIQGINVDEDEISKLNSDYGHTLSTLSDAFPLAYNFVGVKIKGTGFDTGFRQQNNSIHNVSPTAGLAVTICQIDQGDFDEDELRSWQYP